MPPAQEGGEVGAMRAEATPSARAEPLLPSPLDGARASAQATAIGFGRGAASPEAAKAHGEGAESDGASLLGDGQGDATVYESDIELVVEPPVEADVLLKFCQWLGKMAKAEIEETVGSWEGGTSIRILLRRPLPLLEMLAHAPDVIKVWEERFDRQGNGHRFLKMRKRDSQPVAGTSKRLRLILRGNATPKQLPFTLDVPTSP